MRERERKTEEIETNVCVFERGERHNTCLREKEKRERECVYKRRE